MHLDTERNLPLKKLMTIAGMAGAAVLFSFPVLAQTNTTNGIYNNNPNLNQRDGVYNTPTPNIYTGQEQYNYPTNNNVGDTYYNPVQNPVNQPGYNPNDPNRTQQYNNNFDPNVQNPTYTNDGVRALW